MPWRQVDAMKERFQLVRDARNRLVTFTELCALYGISRPVGYKWLHRAEQSGLDFLEELSRRPHSSPHATPAELTARLLEARRHHPSWGPRKLLALLRRQDRRYGAEVRWPARSTVAELLRRNGLTAPRRRRPVRGHPGRPLTPMTAPNVIWTADDKGPFKLGDGSYCFPLTVQDGFSRYSSAAGPSRGRRPRSVGRSSGASFRSMASPRFSAPITACRLRPKRSAASRN